jgi:transcriptional regulator with XRE-family HTH domain
MEGLRPPATKGTLADRLNELFATFKPKDNVNRSRSNGEFFNSEIADKINNGPLAEQIQQVVGAPATISGAYIGELRHGKAADPRLSHLTALAMAFGVPTTYLIAEGDEPSVKQIGDDLARLRTMRDVGVQKVVLRDLLGQTGLSPASQAALTSVFRQLLDLEGIKEDPATRTDAPRASG